MGRLKQAGIGAYVALTMCFAHPAAAQEVRSGRLTGTVADSVHGGQALVGVRVVAVGAELPDRMRGTAITGTDGGFVIDSLPACPSSGIQLPLAANIGSSRFVRSVAGV